MPIDAGGGKRLPVYIPKTKKHKVRKVKPKASPPPRTDVQTSGGDYGLRKAKAFKKTPAYKRSVSTAKRANEQQLRARYTHTGPAKHVLADTGVVKFLNRAAADVANTTVNFIPSTVHLVDELRQQDNPLTRKKGGYRHVAHELAQPYVTLVKHPVREFAHRPFSSGLLVAGPASATTRGAGAAARRGALGKSAKRAASTERAPARVENTNMVHPREYSPDPVVKGAQVTVERMKTRRATRLRKKADRAQGKGQREEARTLRDKAARSDPTRMTEDQAKRRADEIESMNENVRRSHAAEVDRQVAAATKNKDVSKGSLRQRHATRKANKQQKINPKQTSAATRLVAENITAATRESITAYLRDIEQQHKHGDLSPGQRAANEELRGNIQRALDSGEDLGKVEAAARRYVGVERPITEKLVKYKMLASEEVAKRRELPYAVREMGAVRDTKPRMTATGVAKFVTGEERKVAARKHRTATQKQHVASARVTGTGARRAQEEPLTAAQRDSLLAEQEAKTEVTIARNRGLHARQAHIAAKKAAVGKPDKHVPGFVDPTGRELPTSIIRHERSQAGRGEPAYVSHQPRLNRPGSFYRHYSQPVGAGDKAFTGNSVTKGTFDGTPEALHANVRKLQTLVDSHEGHMRLVDETGLRKPNGDLVHGDAKRVEAWIEKLTKDPEGHALPGARKWRVVNLNPLHGRQDALDAFVEALNEHGELKSSSGEGGNAVVQALEDSLAGRGNGPKGAIPEEVAVRIEQHLRVLGSSPGHTWNALMSLWRKNVLAFSTKWAAGNVSEASARSAIAGVRPGDRELFVKALAELEPAVRDKVLGQVGYGHYGFTRGNTRHVSAEEFMDPARHGPFVREMARLLGTADRTPVVNWAPRAYRTWTNHVFQEMSRVEDQFRFAMAGRYLRTKVQGRDIADLSESAIREAAEGLTNTEHQIAMARAIRKQYGQYEAWSPQQRKYIALYTPFIAWTRNAVVFLFNVLPKDHPVLSGLMADITKSQEPWLKEVGLWMNEIDSLPGYLAGSVIGADGSARRVGRYTPLGLLADPTDSAANLVLPAFSTTLMALRGLDAFGNPLRKDKATAVIESVFGGFVPLGGPVSNIANGSGSLGNRLNQQFNPVAKVPAGKVAYARAKATLDRIQKKIDAIPYDKRKKPDGTPTAAYQKLLDQTADLNQTREELLVRAGKKNNPAVYVDREIMLLNRHIRDLPKGRKVDENGYATRELTTLRRHLRRLQAAKRELLGKKPTARIKQRPLSPAEQVRKELDAFRKGQADPEKQIQDELKRFREQVKVAAGN